MRILQVCPRYYPQIGGVETHVQSISERLARKYEVTVATTDPSGKLQKDEAIKGVRVVRFKSWAPNEAYYFCRKLKNYLNEVSESFDVVHAHNYHALPALYAADAKKTNRFVFTAHYFCKGATTFRTLLHFPYKLVARKIFQNADAVICVSNYEKKLLMSNFTIEPNSVSVIPHGVTLSEFKGMQTKCKDSNTILYVGRLEKYKGIDYLIKALPTLNRNVKLDIVGSGSYHKQLTRLVTRMGMKDRVFFYGGSLSREEIVQKYHEAALFVLLSKYEGYAISVAEALASGTPCILANESALTEWIDNKNCFGIGFPIDIDELVVLINRTMGKTVGGIKLFDWDEVTADIVKIYLGDNL